MPCVQQELELHRRPQQYRRKLLEVDLPRNWKACLVICLGLELELELEMLLLLVEMQTEMPNRALQQQERPLRRVLLVPPSPQDQLEHLDHRQTVQQTAQPPLALVLVLLPLPLSKVMSSI
jgi:hypothetical protein